MEKKEMARNLIAGLFFIIGIVLTVALVFAIGKDKGIAQSKFQVVVLYRNIGGLSEGAPVRLAGVNVGNVAAIDFLEREINGRRVKVTLKIFSKFKKELLESSHFAIETEGILGEKLIEIGIIKEGVKIDITKPIIGIDPVEIQELAETFSAAAESFTKTAQELNNVDISEFAEVMEESARAMITTSKDINSIIEELQEAIRKSKRLLDRVEQKVIEGDLFKVF